MRKLKIFYVVLVICILGFCGCGNSEKAELQNQNEELSVDLDEMESEPTPIPTKPPTPTPTPEPIFFFSEYYQTADDYEKIYPLLISYFTCVQNAYEESDKMDLYTFVLNDEYIGICNELSSISNDTSGMMIDGKLNTSNEYRTRLKLINPFLQVEVHLKGGDLIKAVNSSNEEWFSELDELLTDIYYEYENGTGE